MIFSLSSKNVKSIHFYGLLFLVLVSFVFLHQANASSVLYSLDGSRVQQDKPLISGTIDASSYSDMVFSFSYDSTTLDQTPFQDSFSYGWQSGSEKHVLGTILGLTGSTTDEYGVVNLALPEEASVTDLVLFVEVSSNSTTTSDKVELKNILLTGTEKVTEPDPVLDECANLDGIQATVPSGYEKDVNGLCVLTEVEEPVVDLCFNLEGIQEIVPEGLIKNEQNECVLPPPPVNDICPNLDGVQSELPEGYKYEDGKCVLIPVEPKPKPKFCPKGYAEWIDRLSNGYTWSADDVYESVILVGEDMRWQRGNLLNKNIYIPGPTEVGDKYYHRFHRISHVCVR